MNHRRPLLLCFLIIGSLAACGCDSCETPCVPVMPDPRLKPAVFVPDDLGSVPRIVEVRVPVPSPQLRPIGASNEAPAAQTGVAAIAAAKAGATTQPTSDGFLNAIQYYDYAPGIVYTAVTSPGYVTTIALRPGEKLITAAAGDTVRWIVDSVQSGSGYTSQTLLLIKPRKAGLQTNLLITTDQRMYTLDLTSIGSGIYHTMIAWNYPFGDVVMIRNQVAAQQAVAQATVATGLDLSTANFNYLILRQPDTPTPPWCPFRAFDDGQKTYIQFPPKVTVTEAPPLFVLGRNGDAQLVNYRVRGDWYIVDRLFDKAELRLGQAPQTIVAIVRADAQN
ncbi:MAG: P-type conjugative transfer protein TrbG [Tepidisphaeraceae bacterium]